MTSLYRWLEGNGSVTENTVFHASQHSNCVDSEPVEFFKALRIFFSSYQFLFRFLKIQLLAISKRKTNKQIKKNRSTKLSSVTELSNHMFILTCKSLCYFKIELTVTASVSVGFRLADRLPFEVIGLHLNM